MSNKNTKKSMKEVFKQAKTKSIKITAKLSQQLDKTRSAVRGER